MNYELALKLKKAGFPQNGEGEYMTNFLTKNGEHISVGQNDGIFFPALSEIIEACGGEFRLLYREHEESGWKSVSWNEWLEGTGLTAEEAVANLWLALQGKGIRG